MRKTLKKITIITLSLVLVMFVILIYHISTAKPLENATIQVSRIDFDKPFDSVSTTAIKEKLHSIKGVKNEIIVKRNVVVYFHDNRIADSKKIYNILMTQGNYNAKRFVLPMNLAHKKVCPIMKKNSFSYSFSQFIQHIF